MHSAASLSHLEAFIFDLDGVIWKGNAPIEGAVESVARLRAAGKRVFYCTNNSRRAPGEFAETLRALGIECEDEEIMTSSTATSLYLQSLFTGPYTAYVVGEDGLVQTIRRTGAIVMTSPIVPQRSDLHDNHGAVDCVIVGLDSTFTYHKLRVAQRLVMNGARFIATNRDATFPTPYGLVPGAGSVVAAIETASGVTPVTLGKPQPFMAQLLMQKYGLNPAATCMIGDRLDTDIVAARRAGIAALLVTTGVHSREVAERAKNLQKPDAIFDDLPALCDAVFTDSEETAGTETAGTETAGTEAATEPGTGAGVYGAAAVLAAGATVIAADAAQHEPEEVLHTPFAEETADAAPLELDPLEFPAMVSPVAEDTGTANEEPSPVAAEAGAEPTGGTNFFAFDDELSAGAPPAPAEAAAAEADVAETAVDEIATGETAPADIPAPAVTETASADANTPFSFDFADSIATDAPMAPSSAEPEPTVVAASEDEAPAEATDAAEGEEVATTVEGDDKWWESLDNI